MANVYKKIEEYLKREFPKKKIIKFEDVFKVKANLSHGELYGMGGIGVLVFENKTKKEVFYKVIRKIK